MDFDLVLHCSGNVRGFARGFFDRHTSSGMNPAYDVFRVGESTYRIELPSYPEIKSNWNNYNHCYEYVQRIASKKKLAVVKENG